MTKAYDEIINFIAAGATSRKVLKFSASPMVKKRVETLSRKRKITGLSANEEEELADYLQLEKIMRLAKTRAKALLASD